MTADASPVFTVRVPDDLGAPGSCVDDILAGLPDAGPVHVIVNSLGGCARTGAELARRLAGRITSVHIARCASAAWFIVLAGRQCGAPVEIEREAACMVHGPHTAVVGTAAELRAATAALDTLTAEFSALFTSATKAAPETVAAWFDGQDHWLTAEQCVEFGLADAIVYPAPPAESFAPAVAVAVADEDAEAIRLLWASLAAIGRIKVSNRERLMRELAFHFSTHIEETDTPEAQSRVLAIEREKSIRRRLHVCVVSSRLPAALFDRAVSRALQDESYVAEVEAFVPRTVGIEPDYA